MKMRSLLFISFVLLCVQANAQEVVCENGVCVQVNRLFATTATSYDFGAAAVVAVAQAPVYEHYVATIPMRATRIVVRRVFFPRISYLVQRRFHDQR